MKLQRLALALGLALSPALFAEKGDLKTDCFDTDKAVTGRYCISTTEGSKSDRVVYYVHGKGLNETTWSKDAKYYPALLREAWKSRGADAPTVVALSFSPVPIAPNVWAAVEKNKSPVSGLLEHIWKKVIPEIEKTHKLSGDRVLVGESMGGFNATLLGLKTTLFKKVAILCPPHVLITPFASKEEIAKFVKDNDADPKLVAEVIRLARIFLAEPGDWENHSPVALAEKLGPGSPKLYVSCGSRDEYGFYSGTKTFVERARKAGASVQWQPLFGVHCAVDPVSLSAFLVD